MTKLFLTCGFLAVLSACATSQPAPMAVSESSAPAATSGVAPQVAAAPAPAKPKLVCEDDARIDSHFHQRQCYTPEEMEARRKASQEAMRNAQMQGSQCSASSEGGGCGGPPR